MKKRENEEDKNPLIPLPKVIIPIFQMFRNFSLSFLPLIPLLPYDRFLEMKFMGQWV